MFFMKQVGLIFLLVLILSNSVLACAPAMGYFQIHCTVRPEYLVENTCLDENCTYSSSYQDGEGTVNGPGEGYRTVGFNTNSVTFVAMEYGTADQFQQQKLFQFLPVACEEDTSGIVQALQEGKYFREAQFYTQAQFDDLTAGKNAIDRGCFYTDFEVVGNWILTRRGTRSYCDSWAGPDCGGTVLNEAKFTAALAGNPGKITPENIQPTLLIIAPIVGFAIASYFLSRRYPKWKENFQHFFAVKGWKLKLTVLHLALYIGLFATFGSLAVIDFVQLIIRTFFLYIFLSFLQMIHSFFLSWISEKRPKKTSEKYNQFVLPVLTGFIVSTALTASGILFSSSIEQTLMYVGFVPFIIGIFVFLVGSYPYGLPLPILIIPIIVGILLFYFMFGMLALGTKTFIDTVTNDIRKWMLPH